MGQQTHVHARTRTATRAHTHGHAYTHAHPLMITGQMINISSPRIYKQFVSQSSPFGKKERETSVPNEAFPPLATLKVGYTLQSPPVNKNSLRVEGMEVEMDPRRN